jgi:flavin-dependent dehydrogenase
MWTFDAVAVGGGPAGCAFAITAAVAGLRIAIVEKQQFPRHVPGETLHPGVEPLLKQLGVWDSVLAAGFLRHAGHWVEWGGQPFFQSFGQDANGTWEGFQAWRPDFDSILLNRAREVGVTIFQPANAIKPILNGQQIAGVETSVGELACRFLVDACGSKHWLTRQLKGTIKRHSRQLFATYGYVHRSSMPLLELPRIVGSPAGWEWMAPVKAKMLQWTRLSMDKNHCNRQPPQALRDFQAIGPSGVKDVTWRQAFPICKGALAIGDAAFVLDPAASHGVLKAIMSGIFAGRLVVQATCGLISDEAATCNLKEWISDWFSHDVHQLTELYKNIQFLVQDVRFDQ